MQIDMKVLYLPIAATSIAHYFGNACIKPAKFFKNKPSDFQDIYKDALLLTDHCTECCFELVITEDESDLLQHIADGVYLFYGVLPIVRVKSILFADMQVMKTTLSNIRTSTAFIPEYLTRNIRDYKALNIPSNIHTNAQHAADLEGKIDMYNRILGALALMKVARDESMTYSDRYIATASYFNLLIKEQLGSSEVANKDNSLSKLFGSDSLITDFARVIDDDVIAKQEIVSKERIVKSLGIIQLDRINDKMLYTYAVLRTYGIDGDGKKRIDELITKYFADILEDRREAVAMYYGFNRGYNKFTNYYIAPANGQAIDVKFRLDSQLEYYLIESVYQYVFNGKTSRELPYIDSYCPKLSTKRTLKDNEYRIFDTVVSAKIDSKKKVGSEAWWSVWQNIFDNIQVRNFNWIYIRKNIFEKFLEEVSDSFQRKETALNDEIKLLCERVNTLEQENSELKVVNGKQNVTISELEQKLLLCANVTDSSDEVDTANTVIGDEAPVQAISDSIVIPECDGYYSKSSDTTSQHSDNPIQGTINDSVNGENNACACSSVTDGLQQELIIEPAISFGTLNSDLPESAIASGSVDVDMPTVPAKKATKSTRKTKKSTTAAKSKSEKTELLFEN